ncbi:glycosyltransferase family 4 protein [Pseudarthrobacter sp. AL07]|uniref:glycosyltransferase family 4 protein n=1 Tax=unclassified Pseudarthrobacter TaxID=2647000 RepID=UPI00249A0D57|nr:MULTISPECIES: glycosyltransferase family 4 protein [unclassified Pseudarthrobacter]MDI3195998.1 glycosyltransferase family 4 protein [Pseudarthrobacter sp. AL20]MDI3210061.1 glycosyltransferase family 4 protein [Pseudarthrobacter sp. AL07]
MKFLQIRSLVRRCCTDDSAVYGGRFPGVIGAITVGAGKRIGAKTLAHIVGDPYDVLKSGVAGWLGVKLAWIGKMLMAQQVSRVDGAIYVSEQTLQKRYPVHSDAPSLIRSGLSVTRETLASEAKIPDLRRQSTTIVAVGTHDQMYKGHDLLLEAVALLRARGNQVKLDLIGGGSKHKTLVGLARELEIEGHVRFLGHVKSPDQVRKVLDSADLFAMPSRTEGVPRALIEAMARGLPCIGSNIGGIPELLPVECLFTSGSVEELTELLHKTIHDDQWLTEQGARNLDRAREICESLDPRRVSDFFTLITSAPKVLEDK